jgi:hypothetical protein
MRVGEYDASGNILRRYAPGPGADEPVVWYEGAGTSDRRWLHADTAGSIVGYSDSTGHSDATYAYDPNGGANNGSDFLGGFDNRLWGASGGGIIGEGNGSLSMVRYSPQSTQGCNTTNTNGSVQDRAVFFSHISELRNVAQALNVPENYIVGLSSYESGWLDAHNVGLNNLWGLTQAGGNNIHFSSFAAGNAYFVSQVGPYIRNANTLAAFDQGLMNEAYNSVNPNYWSALNGRINSIPKWEGRCGVQ